MNLVSLITCLRDSLAIHEIFDDYHLVVYELAVVLFKLSGFQIKVFYGNRPVELRYGAKQKKGLRKISLYLLLVKNLPEGFSAAVI